MDRQRLAYHLAFWVAYLAFKVYHEFAWLYPGYAAYDWSAALRVAGIAQVIILPPKIGFTYWLLRAVARVPEWGRARWARAIGALAIAVLLHRVLAVYVALPAAYAEWPEEQALLSFSRISSALIDVLLVAGVATALSLYRRQTAARRHAARAEREKLAAELRFLRQQTNPHFLFNTLNNLYGLARRNDPNTAESILRLAQLLRFMLYDTRADRIPLRNEVRWMRDYLALERLRYGDRLRIETAIDVIPPEARIAPLLLIPLLENAFTHGAGENTETGFVRLVIQLAGDHLRVRVANTAPEPTVAPDRQHPNGGGIGLTNLRRQLRVQYPNHDLQLSRQNGVFTVVLELNLADYAPVLLPDP